MIETAVSKFLKQLAEIKLSESLTDIRLKHTFPIIGLHNLPKLLAKMSANGSSTIFPTSTVFSKRKRILHRKITASIIHLKPEYTFKKVHIYLIRDRNSA
jgi:hypothetical protein